MTFEVSAEAYGRFMGRYSEPLGARLLELVGVNPGHRVLDVGCGTGALTALLISQLGPGCVSAVDPSEAFVSEMRAQFPEVATELASAENLPFEDEAFDRSLAQLVVHFMTDPVVGLSEMARVTMPSGVVAASVWDHAGFGGPLTVFWQVVRSLDGAAPDESQLPGAAKGSLAELFVAAGMPGATATSLSVGVVHQSFDEWWQPYTLGVGPAGAYVTKLDAQSQIELREECRRRLPAAPFTIEATAWTVFWRK